MSTCPVCEHPRGTEAECEVCGHILLAAVVPSEEPVEPLDGLETTALGGAVAAGVVAMLPELEPTLQANAGAVAAAPILDLEPTLAERVDAPGEQVPDLEPTSAAPSGDPPTELSLFPVCRYCRTPAGPEDRICGRCGMRLSTWPAPASKVPVSGHRLCSCGTPIHRSICPACGARNRVQ